jgi:hypothetical protein
MNIEQITAGMDRELILEFFIKFGKAEYALKHAGYVLPNDDRADIAWDRFAQDHEAGFARRDESPVKEAVAYLLNAPLRKQTAPGGELRWKASDRNAEPLVKWLTILVRRVRNNLFHGVIRHRSGRGQCQKHETTPRLSRYLATFDLAE